MKSQSVVSPREQFEEMCEVGVDDLAHITGGYFVGDGYCGTWVPGPPRPPWLQQVAVNPQPLPPGEATGVAQLVIAL